MPTSLDLQKKAELNLNEASARMYDVIRARGRLISRLRQEQAKKEKELQEREYAMAQGQNESGMFLPVLGGIAGSFIPGIGTLAGAALGAGAGLLLGGIGEAQRRKNTAAAYGKDMGWGEALGSSIVPFPTSSDTAAAGQAAIMYGMSHLGSTPTNTSGSLASTNPELAGSIDAAADLSLRRSPPGGSGTYGDFNYSAPAATAPAAPPQPVPDLGLSSNMSTGQALSYANAPNRLPTSGYLKTPTSLTAPGNVLNLERDPRAALFDLYSLWG